MSSLITLSFQTTGPSTRDWDYWIDDVRFVGYKDDACITGQTACKPTIDTTLPDSGQDDSPDDADVNSGCNDPSYPPGPYGTRVGDVIANLGWLGKTDANHNGTLGDEPLNHLCLGRYRAAGVAKAIVINASTAWCNSCRLQTQNKLRSLFDTNAGQVAVLQGLLEGPTAGQASTLQESRHLGLSQRRSVRPRARFEADSRIRSADRRRR